MFEISVLCSLICVGIMFILMEKDLIKLKRKVNEHEMFVDAMFMLYGEKFTKDLLNQSKDIIKVIDKLKKNLKD